MNEQYRLAKAANDNETLYPLMNDSDRENAQRVLSGLFKYAKRYFLCPRVAGSPCADCRSLLLLCCDAYDRNDRIEAARLYFLANRTLARLVTYGRKGLYS